MAERREALERIRVASENLHKGKITYEQYHELLDQFTRTVDTSEIVDYLAGSRHRNRIQLGRLRINLPKFIRR